MTEVVVLQMPMFKKVYKKLHKQFQSEVDKAIGQVVKNLGIGKEKKGDLSGVFVYKFKIKAQELLLCL